MFFWLECLGSLHCAFYIAHIAISSNRIKKVSGFLIEEETLSVLLIIYHLDPFDDFGNDSLLLFVRE